MRITSKYQKLNRHNLHARLRTASHRFALMVDNYSPDDTEAQNGLLMVTGKVFVPGYTDATVTIVYPKRKRSTDQSFYYITPTSSTEDMSLAYSDDTFYSRFSECEQAVKDLPEVTVSQYFYDKGIIPDDPSTFTALTGIPLESSLVEDINEITGNDDAYYPPEGSNLQNLITQGILIADDPTIPYYYLTTETPHTVINGITDSHIFVNPNTVASQMIIIIKRSDQHVEYNTSESTGDANGWELVLTSSFAPDSIWTISYDSFNAMDADLQLDRFSELLHKKCAQYGWMYISDLSYQTWVEQYANNFLTLASHEADLAIDDHFSQQCAEGDPWYIRYNDDKTLQYFVATCDALGITRDGNLIFATQKGVEFCETLCDHIENEKGKPSSPLFTVDSLTLNSQAATPIVACIYNDAETSSMLYLPLPSSLASTLSMTTNFIQQLASIQAAAHDIEALIEALATTSEEQEEEDTSHRPAFADSSWTQSSDFPNRWISPLYTAPEAPSCTYQIVWDTSVEQESVTTSDSEEVEYALPTDIIYHTLDGRTLTGFMKDTAYVLGGVKNSGDWDSLSESVRKMLLYVNGIDQINNSSPLLPLDEQMKLLRATYQRALLPEDAQQLDYWTLVAGSPSPESIWSLAIMSPAWSKYIKLQGEDVEFTWDPDRSGYDTPFNVLTFNSNRNSNLSILRDLPWGLVFQDTSYSEQPESITQIASIFDSFESIETNLENNLTRILNQTLELADSENNGNWLDMQEKYMSSLTAFTKSNESSNSQLIYEYAFPEEQVQDDARISSTIGSATLRLIFDGERQELTPELIATAAYDDTLTLTIQNSQLTIIFSHLIGGQEILSGLTNEKTAQHLEKALEGVGRSELVITSLVRGQRQFVPWEQEAAIIQLAESLENNSDIAWDNLTVADFTSRNIFWYCKQYANDPYASTAFNAYLDALADVLQNNGCIPASGSRKLAGRVKNKYYLPVITGVKNMLPAYVQLELSASKTGTVAYIDDSVLYFTTGNTYVSKVDGGELVTFGDDEQPGFRINEKLENVSDLFNVIAEVVSQPIRLLEDEEENLEDYVSDQQLYSQEYMDQYYSDGLLAHHINRR